MRPEAVPFKIWLVAMTRLPRRAETSAAFCAFCAFCVKCSFCSYHGALRTAHVPIAEQSAPIRFFAVIEFPRRRPCLLGARKQTIRPISLSEH